MTRSTADVRQPEPWGGLGRRLRLGVIGGGPGSFIGPVHRLSAKMDDRYDVIASALSSNPARSVNAGIALGIAEDRAYPSADSLFAKEADRSDGIDVLAIMTPNDSHYELAARALGHGWGRHLRQTYDHHTGRCARPGPQGGCRRARFLHHLQL